MGADSVTSHRSEAEYLAGLKADIVDAVRSELAARDDRPLLRMPELGKRLGVSERTARKLVERGDIPSFVVAGNCRVVAPSAADEYVKHRQEGSNGDG